MSLHQSPESSAAVSWETVTGLGAGDVIVVTANGEIDMLSESLLRDALAEAFDRPKTSAIVIDLSAVTFFSSSGIAVLAHARDIAADQDMAVALVAATGSAPDRSLHMLGMTQLLPTYPARAVALAALSDAESDRATSREPTSRT